MKRETKMKWAAKAMALLLAGSAVLGGMTAAAPMTVQAASSVIGTTPTQGKITIHKNGPIVNDPLTGAAFSIYRVIDLEPGDEPGIWASYSVNADFAAVAGMPTRADALGNYSTTELEELITKMFNHIRSTNLEPYATQSEVGDSDADGTFQFTGLPLGYYLVVETEAPAGHVAGKPFLIAVPSTNNYNSPTGAEGTSWVYDVIAEPKNPTVTIEKEQVEGGTDTTADDGTVKKDDFIKYEVNTTIPNYTEEYFSDGYQVVFTITDVMCDGLAIQNTDAHPVTVEVKAADAADYTTVAEDVGAYTLKATDEDGTDADLTVAFAKDYIKNHRGAAVRVTYYAQVTAAAVSGEDGNSNKVYLEYSHQPDDKTTVEGTEVKVFTFDINVLKFAKNGSNKKVLPGAEFGLYSNAACTADSQIGGTKPTNTDGKISFERLDEGTYYLKETKSPAGYTLLADPIMVEIIAKKNSDNRPTGEIELKVNGAAIPADATGNFVTHVDSGNAVVAVENYPGFNLPQTGGAGIALFILIGAAGIIAVSVAMTRKSKKVQ